MRKTVIQNVYDNRYIGVPKETNLNQLERKDGKVKFIINGETYWFNHANDDTNRVSGLGVARELFHSLKKFDCSYDSRRRAIIIEIGRRKKLRSKKKRASKVPRKPTSEPNKEEEYFLSKMKLRKHEYVYNGNEYDFLIKGPKAKKIGKYIEVKGTTKKHVIMFTKNELMFAEKHKRHYWLYLVEKFGSRKIKRIKYARLNHIPDAHRIQFRKYEMDQFETI
jgi:hypothetical protein